MNKAIFQLFPILCIAKNLSLEHRINPPNRELMDVEIVNDIMIIPGNLDGYDFYDISDPTNPTIITNLDLKCQFLQIKSFPMEELNAKYYCDAPDGI